MEKKKIVLVERTMDILEFIASRRTEVTLADISENLGIPKATAFRIVNTLKSLGYVKQTDTSKKYFISYKLLEIANDTINYNDQINKLKPYMKLYAYKYNLSTSLIGYCNDEAVFIFGISINPKNISQMTVGSKMPYYISVAGKNMLATYSDSELDSYFRENILLPYTEYTLTNEKDLRQDIELTKINGFAVCDREFSESTTMIGIPIYNSSGVLKLTLSLILNFEKKQNILSDKEALSELLGVMEGFCLD